MTEENDIELIQRGIEAADGLAILSTRVSLEPALELARGGRKEVDRAQAARLLKSLAVPIVRGLEEIAPKAPFAGAASSTLGPAPERLPKAHRLSLR